MLACVEGPADAALAIEGGAERIGIRLGAGPGCVSAEALPGLARGIAARRPVSLILDASAGYTGAQLGSALAASRADEVRVPCSELAAFRGLPLPPVGVIGVLAAGTSMDAALLDSLQADHLDGLMVDVANRSARLLAVTTVAELADLATLCQSRALSLSLSGALEPPDVPRLLALRPDELCFGRALCRDGDSSGGIDPERVRVIRDLLGEAPQAASRGSSRGLPPDRIFLRDWVLPIRIGAYAYEHGAPQRVRFGVEVDLAGRSQAAADMRDVVSYDLITDSIRRLTAGHIDLVETLAERIAEAVLAHPRVLQVTVTVEKLDLGPGALGCRITRDKAG